MLRFALVLSCFSLAGCQPSTPDAIASPAELSLSEQIVAVRNGTADRVQIEQRPLTDEDLSQLAELTVLRELLIDDPRSSLTRAGIGHLATLPGLEHLRVRSPVDDDMLAAIVELKSLRILNLPQARLSDRSLARLQSLPQLESLRFGSPAVTDAGLPALAAIPAMTRLHLIDVPITDAGLLELAKIERLESLYIDGAELSESALEGLFRQRPRLHVHINQQHHDRDPRAHQHP